MPVRWLLSLNLGNCGVTLVRWLCRLQICIAVPSEGANSLSRVVAHDRLSPKRRIRYRANLAAVLAVIYLIFITLVPDKAFFTSHHWSILLVADPLVIHVVRLTRLLRIHAIVNIVLHLILKWSCYFMWLSRRNWFGHAYSRRFSNLGPKAVKLAVLKSILSTVILHLIDLPGLYCCMKW